MAGNTDNKIMKTLVAVHKILGIYDDCLDSDSLALERLNAKSLKISENRFSKIIIMLSEAGYISGVDVREFSDGSRGVDYSDSQITLDGLKYHAENSLFLKAAGFLPDLLSAGVSVIAG